MTIRERILDWLRVPHEPSAPAGDEAVHVFRAAPNFFKYRVLHWVVGHLSGLLGLVFAVGFLGRLAPRLVPDGGIWFMSERTVVFLLGLLEAGAVVAFFAEAVSSLILLRIDYEQRWYLVSDRSVRIREGLVRLHEKTMTFANIQRVAIRQGPLQRLLGIADLEVRTAGGGGGLTGEDDGAGSNMHIAYFRGIANAEVVRDAIRDRLRQHRDAGLGDPDDGSQISPLLVAARALASEARALRESVTAKGLRG